MATLEEVLDKAIEVAVKRAKTAILNSHPVGSIYLTVGSENPSTVLGGGTWTKVGSGMCLWGADSSHSAGSSISAGLPNITGLAKSLLGDNTSGISFTGALYTVSTPRQRSWSGTTGDEIRSVGFDASKSNSIYGNSSTVQPPAFVVNIWQRTA